MYHVGDKPDGVYLIKEGAFEVTRPTNINQMNSERLAKMNIDPIAKIQLKKQCHVQADSSMKTIKVSILGKGQVFGIEECQVRCDIKTNFVPPRTQTVTCVEHHSKVVFISHQSFSEIVLSDIIVEGDIRSESIIKEFFLKARVQEQQRTIWNGFTNGASEEGQEAKLNSLA